MKAFYTTEEGGKLIPIFFLDFLDRKNQPKPKAIIFTRNGVDGTEERLRFDFVLLERGMPPWDRHVVPK